MTKESILLCFRKGRGYIWRDEGKRGSKEVVFVLNFGGWKRVPLVKINKKQLHVTTGMNFMWSNRRESGNHKQEGLHGKTVNKTGKWKTRWKIRLRQFLQEFEYQG